MKKIVALLLAVISASLLMTSCSGKAEQVSPTNSKGETTYPQSASVLYDRNGDSYPEKSKVKYFDRDGNVYYFNMDQQSYLPTFINEKTGESIDAFFCYISEDGYLVFDKENKISRDKDTTDTYRDEEGNIYYDAFTVEWDKDGNLIKTENK